MMNKNTESILDINIQKGKLKKSSGRDNSKVTQEKMSADCSIKNAT